VPPFGFLAVVLDFGVAQGYACGLSYVYACIITLVVCSSLFRGGFFKGFLFEPLFVWQPISPCVYFFLHPSLLMLLARA
jgi:hypothetical protein